MKTTKLIILMLFSIICSSNASVKRTLVGAHMVYGQQQVQVLFYSHSIVHVVKALGNIPEKGSYSVIQKSSMEDDVTIVEKNGVKTVSSSLISVSLNEKTGEITFRNKAGDLLLTDKGTAFAPCTHEVDKGKYSVEQNFQLDKDEAIFGLGQLRDPAMNQRGRDIEIWNHNTYISIPYFTSDKGYGLYWDNAGKSRFVSPKVGEDGLTTFTSEVAQCADCM